ncbi:SDR family oxidoreductase [Candidatus Saganbacteria bacterium]|nr:SDR family oxidoreductase [Candidatus Saganbacteria bacterium]
MVEKEMILVTGGAGYIGAVLVKKLVEAGEKVRVLDKLYFGDEALIDIKPKIELIKADVREFKPEYLDGVKAVIHLGSLSNDPTAEFDPRANHEINFEGTMRVAEACVKRKVKRMTFASSCAIYGFHLDGIADENFPTNPQSEYAQSKLDAEKGLLSLVGPDFCPVILRQATVFGFSPRMRWDLVINTMTKDAFSKGKIFIYGDGQYWRPLVHVGDVAEAHVKVIRASGDQVKGKIFNLVHKNFLIKDLAYSVKDALKDEQKVEVEILPGVVENRSYRVAGDKIKKAIGWEPGFTEGEGAKEIIKVLKSGKYTDFDNPIYYNIKWMKMLVEKGQAF